MTFKDQLLNWVEAQLRNNEEFKPLVEGPEFTTVAFTAQDHEVVLKSRPVTPIHKHVVGYMRQRGGGLKMQIIIAFEATDETNNILSVAPVYMDFSDPELVKRFNAVFPREVKVDDITNPELGTDA